MKINYVAYLDPFEYTGGEAASTGPIKYSGGGEAVLRGVLEKGRQLGHEIKISSVYGSHKIDVFKKADIYFLADIHNSPTRFIPRRFKRFFDKNFVQSIIQNEKYIHFDNAYCDVCDLDYLPCNGQIEGEKCSFKPRWTFWLPKRCFRRSTCELYKNSILNVFLSPLHRKTVQKILGENIVRNYYECKPTIDPEKFYDQKKEREIENLFVGVICEAKGLENMKKRFPDGNIIMIGKTKRGTDKKFGQRIEIVPYKDLPRYYNRAKNLVFLPRWPDSLARPVIEAALCGCNLITNDNVGALSFSFDIRDPSNFFNAAEEFWETVESYSQKY